MPEAAPTLEALTERLIAFRDARDWRRFHSLKDLIVSLNLEAAEALELTQWQGEASIEAAVQPGAGDPAFRARLAEECADVFIYLLLIAERAGFDLRSATAAKIDKNEAKYPVEKSRGNARKYTEL